MRRGFSLVLVLVLFPLAASGKTLIFQSQNQSSPSEPMVVSEPQQGQSNQAKTYSTSNISSSASSELFFMLEQLQLEVRNLRGIVEEQGHQIRLLQESARNRYRDLDSRVLDLSKKMAVYGAAASAASNVAIQSQKAVQPSQIQSSNVSKQSSDDISKMDSGEGAGRVNAEPTPEQKQAYQKAYNLIKEKQFEQAIDGLHAFIEAYPQGELTGNAYYWLGEVYLVLPELEQAKQAFTIVVRSFPGHRKVADALFKLAVAHDRMQDPAKAEEYLKQVQQEFPESTAAKLASSYKINR